MELNRSHFSMYGGGGTSNFSENNTGSCWQMLGTGHPDA